ncbi:heme-degrading domain-containing protein [Paenibacillus alkaliterrae]|uniref:heme-degrading domain-containing protein n=1 Tax=Paenibacillus alkaliterrae TaxID=320909 RepID=UPI001F2471A2|nr:heme-degrading domain-containing protein [Paenibacillus alkaliterrae]MCF2941006.1 heme-degrading domain-containing protein [Paenibacillus alkaliterrae]
MSKTKSSHSIGQYYAMLSRYLLPQRKAFTVLAALLIGSIGLQLINPQIIRYFIDTAQSDKALERMEREEQELRFKSFTNETALKLGLMIVDETRKNDKRITVDVTREGHRLFLHAMEGTSPENEDWIRRKNNVVNRFGSSSWHVACRLRSEGTTLEVKHGLPITDYVGAGGGFPLFVDDEGQVGTVTVSGLPNQEDHDLLVAALRRILAGE